MQPLINGRPTKNFLSQEKIHSLIQKKMKIIKTRYRDNNPSLIKKPDKEKPNQTKEIQRTPPRSIMGNRKENIRSIAAKRINKVLKNKTKETEEAEWFLDLPENKPAYKTTFAQDLIKSANISIEGSILQYMKKCK